MSHINKEAIAPWGCLSVDGAEVLRFQHERIIKSLFVEFLILLEDLAKRHDIALDKLVDSLPNDLKIYVDLADYLDENQSQILRKRVLDKGNQAIKELNEITKQFNVTIK